MQELSTENTQLTTAETPFEVSEFERMVDELELRADPDADDLTREERLELRNLIATVTTGIKKQAISIDEYGLPTLTPVRSDKLGPLTFNETGGQALLQSDKRGNGQDVAKTFATIAGMTGVDAKILVKYKGIDHKRMLAIFILLTA